MNISCSLSGSMSPEDVFNVSLSKRQSGLKYFQYDRSELAFELSSAT